MITKLKGIKYGLMEFRSYKIITEGIKNISEVIKFSTENIFTPLKLNSVFLEIMAKEVSLDLNKK